jgi:flagella synthesis protein FlgN
MSGTSTSFLQAVATEAGQIEQFVELLEKEKSALTDGRIDELPPIAADKEKLAASLNELSRLRNSHLATLGFAPDRQGMDVWSAQHPEQKETASAWKRSLSLAALAKELNRLNGQLIQLRMQYNSEALAILQRKESTLDLYGPDGRATALGDRKINDAV